MGKYYGDLYYDKNKEDENLSEDEERCSKCGEVYSIWKGHECKPKHKKCLSTVQTGKF